MAAELLPMLARAADTNNDVLSGAKWHFYATGTTTPQNVYTTSGLGVAHANPVVADASGKFAAIYFDASLAYRGVLKTSDGATTIFDIDPINAGVIAALGLNTGAASIGYKQGGTGSVNRTVQARLRDFVTFEDFGAVGDYSSISGTGTDDTTAIQAAIDYAYNNQKSIMMSAKNFLCGNITTYPTTTIIGQGRQVSAFACKTGTTGKWWTDGANGADKLWLDGIAFYGRNIAGLTHVAIFGLNSDAGAPYGTEGLIRGCWFRDAPNAYALYVEGNVGIIRDVTCQGADRGIYITGTGNQLVGAVVVAATTTGIELVGTHAAQLEIEATSAGGLPLKIAGDCNVSDVLISTSSQHSHLIEVDVTSFLDYNISGVTLVGLDTPVTNGIVKVGAVYYGGTGETAFSGTNFFRSPFSHFYGTASTDYVHSFLSGTNGGTRKSGVRADGSYLITGAGKLGYDTGAGGTVTQAASKSTGVTLNKSTGEIVMNNAALAATTSVGFTLTNSAIAATDVVMVSIKSGATADSYTVTVDAVAAGSCRISLRNVTAGSLGEAVVLSFVVLKGVAA